MTSRQAWIEGGGSLGADGVRVSGTLVAHVVRGYAKLAWGGGGDGDGGDGRHEGRAPENTVRALLDLAGRRRRRGLGRRDAGVLSSTALQTAVLEAEAATRTSPSPLSSPRFRVVTPTGGRLVMAQVAQTALFTALGASRVHVRALEVRDEDRLELACHALARQREALLASSSSSASLSVSIDDVLVRNLLLDLARATFFAKAHTERALAQGHCLQVFAEHRARLRFAAALRRFLGDTLGAESFDADTAIAPTACPTRAQLSHWYATATTDWASWTALVRSVLGLFCDDRARAHWIDARVHGPACDDDDDDDDGDDDGGRDLDRAAPLLRPLTSDDDDDGAHGPHGRSSASSSSSFKTAFKTASRAVLRASATLPRFLTQSFGPRGNEFLAFHEVTVLGDCVNLVLAILAHGAAPFPDHLGGASVAARERAARYKHSTRRAPSAGGLVVFARALPNFARVLFDELVHSDHPNRTACLDKPRVVAASLAAQTRALAGTTAAETAAETAADTTTKTETEAETHVVPDDAWVNEVPAVRMEPADVRDLVRTAEFHLRAPLHLGGPQEPWAAAATAAADENTFAVLHTTLWGVLVRPSTDADESLLVALEAVDPVTRSAARWSLSSPPARARDHVLSRVLRHMLRFARAADACGAPVEPLERPTRPLEPADPVREFVLSGPAGFHLGLNVRGVIADSALVADPALFVQRLLALRPKLVPWGDDDGGEDSPSCAARLRGDVAPTECMFKHAIIQSIREATSATSAASAASAAPIWSEANLRRLWLHSWGRHCRLPTQDLLSFTSAEVRAAIMESLVALQTVTLRDLLVAHAPASVVTDASLGVFVRLIAELERTAALVRARRAPSSTRAQTWLESVRRCGTSDVQVYALCLSPFFSFADDAVPVVDAAQQGRAQRRAVLAESARCVYEARKSRLVCLRLRKRFCRERFERAKHSKRSKPDAEDDEDDEDAEGAEGAEGAEDAEAWKILERRVTAMGERAALDAKRGRRAWLDVTQQETERVSRSDQLGCLDSDAESVALSPPVGTRSTTTIGDDDDDERVHRFVCAMEGLPFGSDEPVEADEADEAAGTTESGEPRPIVRPWHDWTSTESLMKTHARIAHLLRTTNASDRASECTSERTSESEERL